MAGRPSGAARTQEVIRWQATCPGRPRLTGPKSLLPLQWVGARVIPPLVSPVRRRRGYVARLVRRGYVARLVRRGCVARLHLSERDLIGCAWVCMGVKSQGDQFGISLTS